MYRNGAFVFEFRIFSAIVRAANVFLKLYRFFFNKNRWTLYMINPPDDNSDICGAILNRISFVKVKIIGYTGIRIYDIDPPNKNKNSKANVQIYIDLKNKGDTVHGWATVI